MRMHIVVTLGLLAGAVPAMASEVYRWVDENGVVNFSDAAPGKAQPGAEVNTLTLEDTAPKDYDPEQDIYAVAAQGHYGFFRVRAQPLGARPGANSSAAFRRSRLRPTRAASMTVTRMISRPTGGHP